MWDSPCQACRVCQKCPTHCLNCRNVRQAQARFSRIENPPLSTNRLLLSWKPTELCEYHRTEWTRLRCMQHPLCSFSSPNNARFASDHSKLFNKEKYDPNPKLQTSACRLGRSNVEQLLVNPALAYRYIQEKKAEKERKRLEEKQRGYYMFGTKPVSSTLFESRKCISKLQAPRIRISEDYGTGRASFLNVSRECPEASLYRMQRPNNLGSRSHALGPHLQPPWVGANSNYGSGRANLLNLSHEAPEAPSRFQTRSLFPRSRTLESRLQRSPSGESLASTATSSTISSRSTFHSGTGSDYLRKGSILSSQTSSEYAHLHGRGLLPKR